MLRCLFWTALLSLTAASAAAQELRITGGITAGTLGIGPELELRLTERLRVRANTAFLANDLVETENETDDLELDGNLRLRSGGAMLDAYPLGGGFRLSAGVRLSAMRATLRATPTTNVTIGTRTVTPVQIGKLRADYRVRDWAPALTLGYAGELRPRLVAGFEAGLLYHGAPRFSADLERERMLTQNDMDDYKIYPMIQASLGYRF